MKVVTARVVIAHGLECQLIRRRDSGSNRRVSPGCRARDARALQSRDICRMSVRRRRPGTDPSVKTVFDRTDRRAGAAAEIGHVGRRCCRLPGTAGTRRNHPRVPNVVSRSRKAARSSRSVSAARCRNSRAGPCGAPRRTPQICERFDRERRPTSPSSDQKRRTVTIASAVLKPARVVR